MAKKPTKGKKPDENNEGDETGTNGGTPTAEAGGETGAAGVGHNKMEVPEVIKAKDEWLELQAQKVAIGKAQSAISAQMKEQFRIPKGNWNEEMKKQKMNLDVRIQHEAQAEDLKVMMGYKASLDLRNDSTPRTEEEYVDPGAAAGRHMLKKGH